MIQVYLVSPCAQGNEALQTGRTAACHESLSYHWLIVLCVTTVVQGKYLHASVYGPLRLDWPRHAETKSVALRNGGK